MASLSDLPPTAAQHPDHAGAPSMRTADFRSDNVASVAPEILAAIGRANTGTAAAYGEDESSREVDARYSALFDAPVRVFPVATGTAANALSLALITPSWGAIYCHEDAH